MIQVATGGSPMIGSSTGQLGQSIALKARLRPSGDHIGLLALRTSMSSSVGPSCVSVTTMVLPVLHASRLPSGDHAGP
jgi:hypothetical protein